MYSIRDFSSSGLNSEKAIVEGKWDSSLGGLRRESN
jgi:hypothetical protein